MTILLIITRHNASTKNEFALWSLWAEFGNDPDYESNSGTLARNQPTNALK